MAEIVGFKQEIHDSLSAYLARAEVDRVASKKTSGFNLKASLS